MSFVASLLRMTGHCGKDCTMIHVVAWHDNTAAHKGNPDPTQWVGWGDRTVDEMAHAWVNVTYITEDDYKEWLAKNPQAGAAIAAR